MKYIKELKYWLVLLAFLVTIGVLFGGQKLADKLRVDQPLKREILAIKGIKDFRVEPQKDGLRVDLQMKAVPNLQTVLDLVAQRVKFYYDKPVLAFKIKDHPNNRLEAARYRLSFYLEEAIASGHYIQLEAALHNYRDLKTKVYLSQDFIYLQYEDGASYLYQALPRNSRLLPVTNGVIGGDPSG